MYSLSFLGVPDLSATRKIPSNKAKVNKFHGSNLIPTLWQFKIGIRDVVQWSRNAKSPKLEENSYYWIFGLCLCFFDIDVLPLLQVFI